MQFFSVNVLGRFPDAWYCVCWLRHDVGSEFWEVEHLRQAQFHDSNPELSAFVLDRPWYSVIRASANDRDLWKEELEDKVSDFHEIRRFVDTALVGKRRGDGSKLERDR